MEKIDWIDEKIDQCRKKISEMEDLIASYESIKFEINEKQNKILALNNKKLLASELISMFPQVLSLKRDRDIAYMKIIVSVELLSIGFTLVSVARMLKVDHTTIIHRKRKYADLIHVKDKEFLQALNDFNMMVGRDYVKVDFERCIKFVEYIKEKYKNHSKLYFINIACFSIIKDELGSNKMIKKAIKRSDTYISNMKSLIYMLDSDKIYKSVKERIKKEFESFTI